MNIQKNMDQLNENGYVFMKNAIPIDYIKSLQSYASQLLGCNANDREIINQMAALENKDQPQFYKFCLQMGQILPVMQIASLPSILPLVRKGLNTPNIYLTDCAVFFNKADVTRLQYDWHTEKSYFPNAEEVYTLWYPWLHNVSTINGTMILAAGSHKKNHQASRVPVKNGLTQMKISEESLSEFEFVPCDLNLGDCVLFKLNLAHRTGPNNSGVPRSTIITRFSDFRGKFNGGWSNSNFIN